MKNLESENPTDTRVAHQKKLDEREARLGVGAVFSLPFEVAEHIRKRELTENRRRVEANAKRPACSRQAVFEEAA